MARKINGNGASSAVPTALLYTRVSSDEQAREGLSLPAQLADTRRYAAGRGWALGGEYQDVLSGKRDDRPGYQALLADLRQLRAEGRPVAVVVKWLDRFGRDLFERARSAKELRELAVPMHSVMEGGEVPAFVADMLAVLAQEEVRRLGQRVAEVRRHAVLNGWYFPGPEPWGYLWRPATDAERAMGAPASVLDVDPLRALYLREAYDRGAHSAVIAVMRWIQTLPPSILDGRHFGREAVRQMLSAPVYVARPNTGDPDVLARPAGHWPALVDDLTWLAVQERIASHVRVPHQASGEYLLSGFLRCPQCGARMCGAGHTSNPIRRRQYRCRGRDTGAIAPDPTCDMLVPAATIDQAVLAQAADLLTVGADAALHADLHVAWARLAHPGGDDTRQRIRELERVTADARSRLGKAAGLLVDGGIDKAGYEALRDAILADVEGANAELARLRGRAPTPTMPDLDTMLKSVGGWRVALETADVPAQRDVLTAFVERVVPHRVARGKYHVEITWTPLGETLRALASG